MSTYRGIAAYVMPRFGIEKACAYIERYRITYAYVPPPVVLAFGKHPAVDKYDLSSLRALTCAAAPLTKDLVQGVWDRLKLPVKQGFGMSEASPGTHVQTPDEWDKHMGSVGKLLPNMKAMIVDEHGKEVPLGEVSCVALVCLGSFGAGCFCSPTDAPHRVFEPRYANPPPSPASSGSRAPTSSPAT